MSRSEKYRPFKTKTDFTVETIDGHRSIYCYVKMSKKVAKTKELLKDKIFADFDDKGNLIGVEILS